MTLTLEEMRQDIARMIELTPEEVGNDENLADLGLDSLRLMELISLWEARGAQIDFGIFAEHATLGGWWSEISKLSGA